MLKVALEHLITLYYITYNFIEEIQALRYKLYLFLYSRIGKINFLAKNFDSRTKF